MFRAGQNSGVAGLAVRVLVILFAGVASIPALPQALASQGNRNNEEVSSLIGQALDAKDPEQKLELAKKAIVLDPNNQAAIALRQEAMQAIEAKAKETEKQKQEKSEKQSRQKEGGSALQGARTALLGGDIMLARTQLNRARQLGQAGPVVDRLDSAIRYAERKITLIRYLWIGSGALVAGSLAGLLIWLKRKRQPYLEAADGKRYRIEGEITNIGAVREYADIANDIVIPDKLGAVSRTHCQIHLKNGKLYLVDYNSANGTYLNGQRIPSQRFVPLRNGARIEVARSAKFRLGFERKRK